MEKIRKASKTTKTIKNKDDLSSDTDTGKIKDDLRKIMERPKLKPNYKIPKKTSLSKSEPLKNITTTSSKSYHSIQKSKLPSRSSPSISTNNQTSFKKPDYAALPTKLVDTKKDTITISSLNIPLNPATTKINTSSQNLNASFPSAADDDGDLEEMDWEPDPSEFDANNANQSANSLSSFKFHESIITKPPKSKEKENLLVIVPDTNILMESIDTIKSLMNSNFPHFSKPRIIIPWGVVQELDGFKKSSKKYPQAKIAIDFIYKEFKAKNELFRGQKSSESLDAQSKFSPHNFDDSILQCALQSCEKNPSGLVVFLTNDKNLQNKSMIYQQEQNNLIVCSGIRAQSEINSEICSKFDQNIIESKTIKDLPFSKVQQDADNNGYLNIATHVVPSSSKTYSNSLETTSLPVQTPKKVNYYQSSTKRPYEEITTRVSLNEDSFMEEMEKGAYLDYEPTTKKHMTQKSNSFINRSKSCANFSDVKEVLFNMLSFMVEFQMMEDIGENWETSLKVPRPWTLLTVIECINKHWRPIFSYVFGPRAHEELLKLKSLLSTKKQTQSEIEEILESALSLLASASLTKSKLVKEKEVIDSKNALLSYLKR